MKNRLKILDIWVDPVNMTEALASVESFVTGGDRPHIIFASNPEKNFSFPKDPFLYESFRDADLLIPDGIGVVKAAKILHSVTLSRVPGVELMHNICDLAAKRGYKVFVYGAKEEVSREACEKLLLLYPGLHIVGRANGYVKANEMSQLIEQINCSQAQILFLALGSPTQEKWLAENKRKLKNVRVCQGIGGTLDTITGTVKRAPEFWCNCNLEWFYRLACEPKRIKRQKVLPIFAAKVLIAKVRNILGLKR
jgi:N-acetylglucosaminyldiphosphoundecaprenol N-acetyl-beta-D-mannosaminyltransferase